MLYQIPVELYLQMPKMNLPPRCKIIACTLKFSPCTLFTKKSHAARPRCLTHYQPFQTELTLLWLKWKSTAAHYSHHSSAAERATSRALKDTNRPVRSVSGPRWVAATGSRGVAGGRGCKFPPVQTASGRKRRVHRQGVDVRALAGRRRWRCVWFLWLRWYFSGFRLLCWYVSCVECGLGVI